MENNMAVKVMKGELSRVGKVVIFYWKEYVCYVIGTEKQANRYLEWATKKMREMRKKKDKGVVFCKVYKILYVPKIIR